VNVRHTKRCSTHTRWSYFRRDYSSVTKIVMKRRRPRCAWCKRAFTPPRRGRRPDYCSAAHRQRAYELRRAQAMVPRLLLGRDIDAMRTKVGIKRAVVDVLRELGILFPAPKSPAGSSQLHIVKDEE
jgi:hypothetical protein